MVDAHAECHETLIVGAGQAGLSVGYHLARLGRPFLILDAGNRIGDAWRERWDSLRLFTPARYDGLDGMPYPAPPHYFPTKDEMGDYLEAYAAHFQLPVRTDTRVDGLTRSGTRFVVTAGRRRFEAENVVVAMSDYQKPKVPPFARELDSRIVQLHSKAYRNPAQLRAGPVLLVGAGNSAAELAKELAPRHRVWMSGRDTGHIPFRIEGLAARLVMVRMVVRVLFHHLLTVRTPLGRRVRRKILHKGGPLIRVKPKDLARAGVERVPRTAGVENGLPLLEDGRTLDAANVIWCTGFHPGFDWIDLPIQGPLEPRHRSGIVADEPGLYFVGLFFLHSLSSAMIHGVGRDARRVAEAVTARMKTGRPASSADRPASPTVLRVAS
ncbi:MAG: NAD(P)/FAD-dependent oxidoreductase [Gemmatimonadetes bacterium]|nr:NAD(P)/FAD-dependent oxidoreductase [Gemmatimonadota bacterium]